MNALCATRPADWWDLGDDGNRLALLLCSVCPVRARCVETASKEHGVIRAGVAYDDDGRVLPLCACGYPNRHTVPWRGGPPNRLCHRCAVPVVVRSSRKRYWERFYRERRGTV